MKPTPNGITDNHDLDLQTLRIRLLEGLRDHSEDYPHQTEKQFPRIFAKLVELWGSDVFQPYIDSLTFSDRPERQGFPPAVAMELFRLSAAHQALGLSREKTDFGWTADDPGEGRNRAHK
jgi:hypothetical protein